MKCPHCGNEDKVLRDYCISCGQKLDYSSEESEILLIESKRTEREKRVAKRVRSWVAVAVAVLIGLITFRSLSTSVPHEEVDAYFAPPVVDVATAEKLPITVTRLPVPSQKQHIIRMVAEKEPEIVQNLMKNVMKSAPEIRLKDGSKVRGFILDQYGDAATIFTAEGKRKVAIASPQNGK